MPDFDPAKLTGEALYNAFWTRNFHGDGEAGPRIPWNGQALAIKAMWENIASDALKIAYGED